MVCADNGDVDHQLIDQSPGTRRLDDRLAPPFVRHETVADMSVQRRPGTRPMMVVIGSLMRIGRLEQRKEPVPVQQREVGTRVGRRMPSKQMVVMVADLTGPVVMANVVIVSLRQRDVNHAQNHDPNQEGFAIQSGDPCASPSRRVPRCSFMAGFAAVGASALNNAPANRIALPDATSSIMKQHPAAVKFAVSERKLRRNSPRPTWPTDH